MAGKHWERARLCLCVYTGRAVEWPVSATVHGQGSRWRLSINVMVWARGHKSDWDYYAEQTKDPSWSYASVLNIYKRIEDWHGTPDPAFRGSGGLVFVQPPMVPGPLGAATLEAAKFVGISVFENQNGLMMEGDGGAARMDLIIKDGQRRSIYRAYVAPFLNRPNLTVLSKTLVNRLIFEGNGSRGLRLRGEDEASRRQP